MTQRNIIYYEFIAKVNVAMAIWVTAFRYTLGNHWNGKPLEND